MTYTTSYSTSASFASLLTLDTRQQLYATLKSYGDKGDNDLSIASIPPSRLQHFADQWQQIKSRQLRATPNIMTANNDPDFDYQITNWFIDLFNSVFSSLNVRLVRGDDEPEYFPASENSAAQIVFAHGYLASALHEVSHWCIAGKRRRQLLDYGYWYAADGRSEAQQKAFEQVEIKPQALECLFSLACHQPFRVSQDNLFATFDTSNSTFEHDVYTQVQHYIADPQQIPRDAKYLLAILLKICK